MKFAYHAKQTEVAEKAESSEGQSRMFGLLERHYKILITSLALLLTVGYVHKLCWLHKGEENFEYGYYPYENWKEGRMRWTWRKACMKVKGVSDLFGFRVVAAGYNSTGSDGLTFMVFLDGEMLDRMQFFDGGSRNLYYYVPNIEGKEVEIGMEVDRTFNPLRMGINEDGRDLGVAVGQITFLKIMLKDGIGFYGWETTKENIAGWPEGMEKRFRWTGKRASQAIADCGLRIAEWGERRRTEDGRRRGGVFAVWASGDWEGSCGGEGFGGWGGFAVCGVSGLWVEAGGFWGGGVGGEGNYYV